MKGVLTVSRLPDLLGLYSEAKFNKAINNSSLCPVLFLSRTGLFPARRKILEHETQSSTLTFFISAGNNPGVLKNSTENNEPLFITFRQFQ